jgi:PKD repeat protein
MKKIFSFTCWMALWFISHSVHSQTCVAKFKYEVKGQNVLIINQSTYTGSPQMDIISDHVIHYTSGIPIDTLTIHYTIKGKYSICLTISDKDSALCDTYCDTVNIVDAPACQAKVYFSGVFFTGNNSYGITPATTYFWDLGDGTTSTKSELVHGYAVAGEYNICLTISDTTTGCTTKECLKRTFLPINCTAAINPITSHDSTIFFPLQLQPYMFYPTTNIWEYGDGQVGTIPRHTYDAVGTYSVCYSGMDTNLNCKVEKICTPVTIIGNDSCKSYFGIKKDYIPDSFYFDNGFLNVKSVKYYWNFGDGTSGAGPNIHHKYPTPPPFSSKEYLVCLKIVDTVLNCQDSICKKIMVSNYPMSIDDKAAQEEDISNLSVFPNPFLTDLHIKFTLNHASPLQFFIYNFQGQKVTEQLLQKELAGEKDIFLNLESLSNGVYLLLIKTDQNQITKRILKP